MKLISNSGIGQMARGLSNKTSFNMNSNTRSITPTGDLTNPLYTGWITSFIRTVLSEILNYIHKNTDNIIISCTTDGLICNTPNLNLVNTGRFSEIYRIARENLGYGKDLLEQKGVDNEGIIS